AVGENIADHEAIPAAFCGIVAEEIGGAGKDIVDPASVADGEAIVQRNLFGGVRLHVRRAALVGEDIDRAEDEVVCESRALRIRLISTGREEQVVGDEKGAMVDFGEKVTALVVVEKIAGDAGALCHPVEPDAADAAIVVDVVVGDDDIDGGVELDAGHFLTAPDALRVAVADVVAGHLAEGTTEAADDAGLATVVYPIVADDVGADVLFRPAPGLERVGDREVVAIGGATLAIEFVGVLAERDAGTTRIADLVVLDDPALVPVGADETALAHGGCGPVRRGIAQFEAGKGDVVDAGLFRCEDGGAHADLDGAGVRIGGGREARVNRRVPALPSLLVLIHVREPGRLSVCRLRHRDEIRSFREPLTMQVDHATPVLASLAIKPVSAYFF